MRRIYVGCLLSGRARGDQRGVRRVREGDQASRAVQLAAGPRSRGKEQLPGGGRELGRRRGLRANGPASACRPKPNGSAPAAAWQKAEVSWGDEEPTSQDARFNGVDGPGEVCKLRRNYFGLCDIAGNVWEWCADWYDKDYYENAPERNPQGPETGMYRVLRGGSWADEAKYLTCANRSWARPAERSPNIGFRCAKSFK